MRLRLIAVSGILLFLGSCSKEVSVENGNNTPGTGGGTNGTNLVRIGYRLGVDTMTTDYSYNSANFLNGITYSGTVGGHGGLQTRIVRNASNIITSQVTKGPLFLVMGIDSFVATYAYDAAQSRYRYGVTRFSLLGLPVSDSVVYTYNSNNKLVSGISYYDDGTGYEIDSKEEITYNGSNIATVKQYTHDGTGFELQTTTTFDQYDTRMNPLQFTADAPVLGMLFFYPANNVVKRTTTDHASGTTESGTIVYTYHTNNRPLKATSTQGVGTSAATYYYQ
jgi:hypothetical protein